MSSLTSQILHAIRALRKNPGFTLSALVILTLGIGANTAIFSVVNSVLLRPLPFPQSESVVTISHVPPAQAFPGVSTFAISPANYIDWKNQADVFEFMAVLRGRNYRLGGTSRPEAISIVLTEPDFFRVLQVQPAVGRAFTAEECQPGRDAVVVLSHEYARTHFEAASAAVGRELILNGRNHRVIGVMPQEFRVQSWFPAAVQMWGPIAWTDKERATRDNHNHLAIGRLRKGATVKQAQSQMDVISERLAREYPKENTGWGATVVTLRNELVGNVRPALLTLLGAVGFVLLIACANVANLVLARTLARRKELAIRSALGASTAQTIRPVLLETTLLSLAGGALGLVLAEFGQSLVIKALAQQLPRSTEVQLDSKVLAFTLLVSVFTGIASGMIACWRLLRVDLNDSLKQGLGKTDALTGGNSTRNALVVSEVALSLMLLVGAGLMIRSLWALRAADPGFDSTRVMTMIAQIPPAADAARHNKFYAEFLTQVRALPGVVSVGAIDTLPLSGGGSHQPVAIEGRPAEVFAMQPNIDVRVVTPGYRDAMKIPLLKGRDFEEKDTLEKSGNVLISESFAERFWPGENPIGKSFRISFTPEILREVVGVVGDVKERGIGVLEPVAMIYTPLNPTEQGLGFVSLVVRGERDAASQVPAITAILQKINPELTLRRVRSMEELVAISLSQQRFSMFLFVALASLAFLLAAVEIYSVLAYSVRRRVQEISIRMALGAQVSDVLRLIVTEGMKPTLVGVVVGGLAAAALSGLLSRLIYGVSTTDPWTFGSVALMLIFVALVACLIPAYRATRVEPLNALRNE